MYSITQAADVLCLFFIFLLYDIGNQTSNSSCRAMLIYFSRALFQFFNIKVSIVVPFHIRASLRVKQHITQKGNQLPKCCLMDYSFKYLGCPTKS